MSTTAAESTVAREHLIDAICFSNDNCYLMTSLTHINGCQVVGAGDLAIYLNSVNLIRDKCCLLLCYCINALANTALLLKCL